MEEEGGVRDELGNLIPQTKGPPVEPTLVKQIEKHKMVF